MKVNHSLNRIVSGCGPILAGAAESSGRSYQKALHASFSELQWIRAKFEGPVFVCAVPTHDQKVLELITTDDERISSKRIFQQRLRCFGRRPAAITTTSLHHLH